MCHLWCDPQYVAYECLDLTSLIRVWQLKTNWTSTARLGLWQLKKITSAARHRQTKDWVSFDFSNGESPSHKSPYYSPWHRLVHNTPVTFGAIHVTYNETDYPHHTQEMFCRTHPTTKWNMFFRTEQEKHLYIPSTHPQ